jgi:hypothetical protein
VSIEGNVQLAESIRGGRIFNAAPCSSARARRAGTAVRALGRSRIFGNDSLRLPVAVAVSVLLASCSYFQPPEAPKPPVRAAKAAPAETKAIPIVQPPPEEKPAAFPVPRPVAKPNMLDPKILVGLDQVAVEDLIGKPLDIYDEPPATVWSYKGEACSLDVYFFLDIGTHKMRALSYDVKTQTKGDHDGAARLCVGQLQADYRAKQR